MSTLQYRDYQGEVEFDEDHLAIRILHIDDFITREVDSASQAAGGVRRVGRRLRCLVSRRQRAVDGLGTFKVIPNGDADSCRAGAGSRGHGQALGQAREHLAAVLLHDQQVLDAHGHRPQIGLLEAVPQRLGPRGVLLGRVAELIDFVTIE